MKRIIAVLLVFSLLFLFVSCKMSIVTPLNLEMLTSTTEYDDYLQTDQTTSKSEITQSTTEATTIPAVDIDWTTIVVNTHDMEGYTYAVTFKLSPFIFISSTAILNSAWSVVGKNNTLPTPNNLSLQKKGNNYIRELDSAFLYSHYNLIASNLTDMYYCVGSVSVKNTTEGWDITSSDYRTFEMLFEFVTEQNDYRVATNSMGRIFYSSEYRDYHSGIRINPKLEGNNWGPCSFMIVMPETFSPNSPNGSVYNDLLNKTGFVVAGDSVYVNNVPFDLRSSKYGIKIGVIDKDGKYEKTQ